MATYIDNVLRQYFRSSPVSKENRWFIGFGNCNTDCSKEVWKIINQVPTLRCGNFATYHCFICT
jgi:hypothetical protein